MTKESNAFMTPDSLRKALSFMKNFFDSYTKNNVGYEDINGSQYSGIVNNFGSELLLEARKLLLDKPPLTDIIRNDMLSFYFDMQYSDRINTYEQQGLMVGVLKKDTLLSNKEYRIQFSNCEDVYIVRSESWSEPSAHREKYIHTKTIPKLIIHDLINEGVTDIEIPLYLTKDDTIETDYYFPMDIAALNYIDTYENNTMTTIPLTDKLSGLPFIWACVDIFRLLPELNFVNNVDVHGNTLLTMGTDGHGIHKLYPLVYGKENYPSLDVSPNNEWWIKAYPMDGWAFSTSNNDINNYNIPISRIEILNSLAMGWEVESTVTLTFNTNNITIKLSPDREGYWYFRKALPGNYDYDGTTYNNPVYGFIDMLHFERTDYDVKSNLLAAFNVTFNDSYLHPYEYLCGNAVSGIHIDSSSEYTDNGVSKKNGIIHNLCDFDGLPKYFQYVLNRTMHRAHVEMYSIRDRLNNTNQNITEKQLAALIVDSAIPQTESITPDDLNLIIKYDLTKPRHYKTDGVSISENNSLSELTYIDKTHIGNSNMYRQGSLPKFIYHGNRCFSLSVMSLDPDLEYSRVYYINNDTSNYENNGISNHKKPARSLCRICDIPTSFVQLMNITGNSPTLVIDELYVRQGAGYTEADNELLMNERSLKLVVNKDINDIMLDKYLPIYPNEFDLNTKFTNQYLINNGYAKIINMNRSLDMTKPSTQIGTSYNFNIFSGGSSYAVDDKFTIIIGGIYMSGIVTSIDSGVVTGVSFENDNDAIINIGNFASSSVTYSTTTITGDGSGLKLTLDILIWDSLQPKIGNVYEDIYVLKLDEFNNVWAWKCVQNMWVKFKQITGLPIVYNWYDTRSTQPTRTITNVLLSNLFNIKHDMSINYWYTESDKVTSHQIEVSNIEKSDIDINTTNDYSSKIIHKNKQDALYVMTDSEETSEDYYTIITYEKYKNEQTNKNLLPHQHVLNLPDYHNRAGNISLSFDTKQPTMCYYNPFKNTINSYDKISSDVYSLTDSREFTFVDMLKPIENIDDVLDTSSGKLNNNVYCYDEYEYSDYIKNIKTSIETFDHNALIFYIRMNISKTALPILFEDTEYEYTDDMLRTYILQNIFNSPVYHKDGIKLLRTKGESVVEYVNGKYKGIGKQPTGGYKNISSTIFNPSVKIDNISALSEFLYVFKIPKYSSLTSLDNFRMIDDEDNDISLNTLLIYNNEYYMMKNNQWIKMI